MPLVTFILGLVAGALLAVPFIIIVAKFSSRRAQASERRARQSEHLAEVGRLTGGLAHEIRNPLSTLNLNLQLLREDLVRPGASVEPRTVARLDSLEQEARRLQTILDDFLKFAGRHEVHLKSLPLGPLMAEAAAFYSERLQRAAVHVRTQFADGLPPVALDADRFKQALSNLILNAEAAMPEGGDLLITAEPERHGVRVHITDTGVGIPPESLDKIFEPYYSTRSGGSGLGLPMVRRIVQEHGGSIEVHSEVGRGTRFTIHLPASQGS